MNLHRRGLACRVYESAPEIKPLGVGITLLPHAMREYTHWGSRPLAEVAIEIPKACFNRYGSSSIGNRAENSPATNIRRGIHRGKLHMILFAAAREEIGSENIPTNHHAPASNRMTTASRCVSRNSAPVGS